MLYVNTIPFYTRDLSILKFWCPQGSWNQSPVGTKGQLYTYNRLQQSQSRLYSGMFFGLWLFQLV